MPQEQKIVRIAALGLLWAFAVAIPLVIIGSSGVPEGTTVNGVNIGGLSRDDAVAAVSAAFSTTAAAPISVNAAQVKTTADPADFGLGIDPAATVDQAVISRFNPFNLLTALFGSGSEIPLSITVDEATLDAQVNALAERTKTLPVEPELTFDGTAPLLAAGQAGRAVDVAATKAMLVRNYLSPNAAAAELPVITTEPLVSNDQARAFAADTALKAVSAPVILRAGSVTTEAPAQYIGESLAYQVKDGQLTAVVDGTKLHQLLADKLISVDTPGTDATWKIIKGVPTVVPSTDGSGVTDDAVLGSLLAGVLDKTGSERAIDVPLGPLPAKVTTEAANALGITEQVSTYTQKFPYADYRYNNIKKAAAAVDGTVIPPGGVFSMNDIVGERTAAKGYVKGPVVGEGGAEKLDLGGGVSTATTAIYLAAFYGGFEQVERGAHLIWISRYIPGLEATVAWGQLDMKFRNNTPAGIFITTKVTGTSMKVSIYGKKQFDSVTSESDPQRNLTPFATETSSAPDCVNQSGAKGFDIRVWRVLKKAGQEDVREPIDTHYLPGPAITCVPVPPAPKPAATAPATPAGAAAVAPGTKTG